MDGWMGGWTDGWHLCIDQPSRANHPPPPGHSHPRLQNPSQHALSHTRRFFGGEFAFEHRWRNFCVLLVFVGLCQLGFFLALKYRRFEKR